MVTIDPLKCCFSCSLFKDGKCSKEGKARDAESPECKHKVPMDVRKPADARCATCKFYADAVSNHAEQWGWCGCGANNVGGISEPTKADKLCFHFENTKGEKLVRVEKDQYVVEKAKRIEDAEW